MVFPIPLLLVVSPAGSAEKRPNSSWRNYYRLPDAGWVSQVSYLTVCAAISLGWSRWQRIVRPMGVAIRTCNSVLPFHCDSRSTLFVVHSTVRHPASQQTTTTAAAELLRYDVRCFAAEQQASRQREKPSQFTISHGVTQALGDNNQHLVALQAGLLCQKQETCVGCINADNRKKGNDIAKRYLEIGRRRQTHNRRLLVVFSTYTQKRTINKT